MSTVQQLLAQIDALYPNSVDTTNKVLFMNIAQNELSMYFGLIAEDTTLTTTAGTDTLTFPTGINDISQIETLDINNNLVSLGRNDFTRYEVGYVDDTDYSGKVVYQIYTSAGVKSLVIYPAPTVTGLTIRIRYRKALTELSPIALTVSPDFDSRFHDMLALYACYMICSTGANPDYIQSNRFMDQYDARVIDLWKHKMETEKVSRKKHRDGKQWH